MTSNRLSIPSVVLAEASWYGSMRGGWASGTTSGVDNFGSRWGVRGSTEASEGLTAVYGFETGIDINTADQDGRLSWAGLSGGFGSVTLGRIWSASDNHVGAILDNSHWLGTDGLTGRHGNVLSYSAGIGSLSFQVDLTGNSGGGESATNVADDPNTLADESMSDDEAVTSEDKDIDSSQMGATLALGENARIAVAHINYDTAEDVDRKETAIAGEYTIGGVSMYLGYSQEKFEDDRAATAATVTNTQQRTDKTTFLGLRGDAGDTGVSYLLQVRSIKASGEHVNGADLTDASLTQATNGHNQVSGHTPIFFSLSRSLGGGARILLEHHNYDKEDRFKQDSDTALILRVDF